MFDHDKDIVYVFRAHPEDPGIAGDVEDEEDDCQGDQDHRGQKVVVKVAQNLGSESISPKSYIFKSSTLSFQYKTSIVAMMISS